MARFLMCPADYFGIEYEINPWMRLSVQVDRARARSQWRELHSVLTEELGAQVELMEPVRGLPDLVFTANAGYVSEELFVSSSFKHPERQRETPHFDAWFQAHGYSVHKLAPDCPFEGAGDALPLGESIFAGYRHRSEVCSHQGLSEATGRRVLSLELVDPLFYHLDTCFCPWRMASPSTIRGPSTPTPAGCWRRTCRTSSPWVRGRPGASPATQC